MITFLGFIIIIIIPVYCFSCLYLFLYHLNLQVRESFDIKPQSYTSNNYEFRQCIFWLPIVLYFNACYPYGATLITWLFSQLWPSVRCHYLKKPADGYVKC